MSEMLLREGSSMDLTNLKSGFTLIVLFMAAYASLATSAGRIGLFEGKLTLSSDCVTPAKIDNVVTVTNFEITDPVATSYTDFGFPESTVGEGVDDEEVGPVNGKNRRCSITYEVYEDVWVYSCFDNGDYACTITIENF